MNLIINSITIVDLTNKEAKRIVFSSGKNMLTSGGNHLGKSVIMKSLYYTLGAEVFFPNPIKRINLLTFLDFSLIFISTFCLHIKFSEISIEVIRTVTTVTHPSKSLMV